MSNHFFKIHFNHFKKITMFLLFGAFLFFCSGGLMGIVFSMDNMDIAMGHNTESHAMSCCSVGNPLNSMDHNIPVLSVSIKKLLKILMVIFIAFFIYFILKFLQLFYPGYFYIQHIRRRYGGWHFFNTFVNLFRIGILHPKTW
jgi:hypothetical protein